MGRCRSPRSPSAGLLQCGPEQRNRSTERRSCQLRNGPDFDDVMERLQEQEMEDKLAKVQEILSAATQGKKKAGEESAATANTPASPGAGGEKGAAANSGAEK